MDWAKAISINRKALSQIVAEILALIGVVNGGFVQRLPQALYAAAERLLRPTESALRRLIVIAARGLVVKPWVKRALPAGLIGKNSGERKISFRLFDKRKKFDFNPPENPLFVTVKTYTNNPFNLFNPFNPWADAPRGEFSAVNLCRRLAAVSHALKNLPAQAQRMARWQARRKALEKPKFTSPLRVGPPPGHRQKPTKQVDFILQECHWLAWDSLRVDSS